MNSSVRPVSDDRAYEGLAGIDADSGQEDRQAEIAQHDVGRQRHDPEHRAGAAQLAEDERDDQRAAADAERDRADAGIGIGISPSRTPSTMPMPSET